MRLTGDPQADADIMAFVKARQNILQQSELVCYSGKVIDNVYIVCSFGQTYGIDGGNLILLRYLILRLLILVLCRWHVNSSD